MTGSVRLGRALTISDGPLVERDERGNLVAVCSYGPGQPPGVLIVGTSGGGKTNLLRYMLINLVRDGTPKAVHLADGKGAHSFLMFEGQPGIASIVTREPQLDEDPVLTLVREFEAGVRERYAAFADAKRRALETRSPVAYEPPPLLFLVLDEYMDWVMSLSDDDRKEATRLLAQVGSVGREANARLWLATQAPYARAVGSAGLPGMLKLQLGCRVAVTGRMGLKPLEGLISFDDAKVGRRIEAAADRAGLRGPDRLGVGLVQVASREVAFKAPRTPDPLHWETSPADAAAVWGLMPYDLRRVKERQAALQHGVVGEEVVSGES